jgi:hypothetical protein
VLARCGCCSARASTPRRSTQRPTRSKFRATTDDHDKRTGEIVAGVALSRERVADVQVASRRLESAAIAYAEALPKRRRRRRV